MRNFEPYLNVRKVNERDFQVFYVVAIPHGFEVDRINSIVDDELKIINILIEEKQGSPNFIVDDSIIFEKTNTGNFVQVRVVRDDGNTDPKILGSAFFSFDVFEALAAGLLPLGDTEGSSPSTGGGGGGSGDGSGQRV
ncbi:MAG: hypothetical protein KI790_06035 [Cyclobacteriaceae bacterium]|nr:hypothetical protein [Cyclobacteriaceae bacterium HetDA_MAG_MS6]